MAPEMVFRTAHQKAHCSAPTMVPAMVFRTAHLKATAREHPKILMMVQPKALMTLQLNPMRLEREDSNAAGDDERRDDAEVESSELRKIRTVAFIPTLGAERGARAFIGGLLGGFGIPPGEFTELLPLYY
jgi:hypothetical protein